MGCLDVRGTRSVELASKDSCSSETISVFVRKSHCGALFLFEVINNNLLALSPSLVWSGLVWSSSVIRETWWSFHLLINGWFRSVLPSSGFRPNLVSILWSNYYQFLNCQFNFKKNNNFDFFWRIEIEIEIKIVNWPLARTEHGTGPNACFYYSFYCSSFLKKLKN